MRGTPAIPVRGLNETIEANITAGRLTNPDIRCVGVAINTSRYADDEAAALLREAEQETGLPAVDPVRTGVVPIVDALA